MMIYIVMAVLMLSEKFFLKSTLSSRSSRRWTLKKNTIITAPYAAVL